MIWIVVMVDILLSTLKSLFAKDISQASFIAYGKFEKLYNNIKKNNMKLPTGVLAYRLLECRDIWR